MMALTTKHHDALLSNTWFAELSPAIREDVLSRARQRMLAQGRCLFRRGDNPDFFSCVLEGCVRISGTSMAGRDAVLDFYGPGVWFGEIAMLDGLVRTHDAYAHTNTLLLQISTADFEELLLNHSAFSRMFLRLTCARIRALADGFEAYTTQTLEQRLASRFLALIASFGQATAQGTSIELHLSQEIVAQMVGSTRQRVNQLIKDWESAGLIAQHYGHFVLRDVASLRALVQA